jgi:hypothetical protein
MRRILVSLFLCAMPLVARVTAGAIAIDTVPIGNPGNANDSFTGNNYGGVAYNYSIGKYDVTVGQYTAFLNAVGCRSRPVSRWLSWGQWPSARSSGVAAQEATDHAGKAALWNEKLTEFNKLKTDE